MTHSLQAIALHKYYLFIWTAVKQPIMRTFGQDDVIVAFIVVRLLG